MEYIDILIPIVGILLLAERQDFVEALLNEGAERRLEEARRSEDGGPARSEVASVPSER